MPHTVDCTLLPGRTRSASCQAIYYRRQNFTSSMSIPFTIGQFGLMTNHQSWTSRRTADSQVQQQEQVSDRHGGLDDVALVAEEEGHPRHLQQH